ncbi:MAG: hypothetical protein M3Z32_13480 [Acidobacteriota bacterium]|nr:hypothetical protein [Acidobacteriota bacterium]
MRKKTASSMAVLGPCIFSALFAASAVAAPKLRLDQTAFPPLAIAQGANGAVQTVDARNAGDGTLNLQVSSTVPWLSASLGAPHTCADGTGSCTPIRITPQTASLAKGTYTGFVTVSDPNAIDAPQTIAVTVQVGGNLPDKLEYFLPPGGMATSRFTTAGPSTVTASTQGGGQWLSVAQDGTGTFLFNVPYKVTVSAGSLAASDYNGSISVTGSSLTSDNKSVPVTLHVTTQPVAQLAAPVTFRIAQNGPKQTLMLPIGNGGQGTLAVSGITVTPGTGGNFLTAQTGSGNTVMLVAEATGLAPGTYTATAVVASNAANSSFSVPVQLDVVTPTGPIAKAGGVVNNATFAAGESVAQGDIVALFGDQLVNGDPVGASTLPLTATLAGVQVFVNDQPAPVYYVSAGQINFQIPFNATPGEGTVRVERNGQRGNTVSAQIARSVPRLLRLGIGDYGIITNQDLSFPIPTTAGLSSHPAKAGDALTIYAIGLGPTSPAVASGAGSPSVEPLGRVVTHPKVCFGTPTPFNQGMCVDPLFVGLSPGFVGLYQINVVVPANVLASDTISVRLTTDDGDSNAVQIAVK